MTDDYPEFYRLGQQRLSCGRTEDDAVCRCGCSGYDDRCAYWSMCYELHTEVDVSHTCCRVFSI